MADPFNPYAEWLGLPAEQTEPNHYQLLGLANFEENTAKIATGADRAMSRVRGFRPGANARAWSKLLDELLLAKGKLLDPERKQEYDAELRESGVSTEKNDEPATSPTSAQTPASVPFDPRFPPGMGPNSGKSAPKEASPPQPIRNPAPAPVAPAPIAAPIAQPIAALVAMPLAAPVATFASVPPAAWPNSMLHPAAHAPAAAPTPAIPQQPAMPQPAPVAQPMYGAPQIQPGYAAPGYPQYPGVPQQYGMPQPGYGQQPYPQPGYGAPPAPQYGAPMYQQPAPGYGQPYGMPPQSPPPAEPPVSAPYGGYGAFSGTPGSSLGGTMFGPSAHAPQSHAEPLGGMPLDPMAPVAMPTALPGGDESKNRVVGFAAGQQSAIPKGKAVSPTPAAPGSSPAPVPERMRGSSLPPVNTSSAPSVPSPMVSASLPDSTVAAAHLESSKHDKMLFWGSAGAIVLLIGAIVFAIVQGNQVNREVVQNPTIPPEPAPRVEPKPATGPAKTIMPAIKPSETKPPVTRPVDPTPPPPKPQPPKPEPKEPTPPEVKPQPPEMKPELKPMETIPVPTPPKPPEPKPPEPTPPTEVKLTPAELMALSTHLKSAKEALRERNFAETETNIAAALKLAKSPEQLAQTNRLKLVADYVKQFDRSLKTLMADENFDAGAELVIGKGTRVVVVERNPSMIVIRIAGMNKSYALASLPDGLAMALIDKRLDPNESVTKIIKASYLAAAKVSTEDNQEKAKSLWEEARAVDPQGVGDLPMFLTDTYEFTE